MMTDFSFLLELSHKPLPVMLIVSNASCVPECPNVRELHVELDEVSQLLEASKQEYEEVLEIVQHHTKDTISWLSNMASDFGWVTELANNNTTPESIFSIATVRHEQKN